MPRFDQRQFTSLIESHDEIYTGASIVQQLAFYDHTAYLNKIH